MSRPAPGERPAALDALVAEYGVAGVLGMLAEYAAGLARGPVRGAAADRGRYMAHVLWYAHARLCGIARQGVPVDWQNGRTGT